MAGSRSQEERLIVVYDCMIFLRAAAKPERGSRLFQLVHAGEVVLALSPEILAEIQDVLTRPEHQARFPAMTPAAVNAFLERLLQTARLFPAVREHYLLERDPKDSKYINLAIEAGASHLVTWDKDLLELRDPTRQMAQAFRQLYPALEIVTGEEFIGGFPPIRTG